MKPYPLELRLHVVAAYEEGQGTIFEIAALFHVGPEMFGIEIET